MPPQPLSKVNPNVILTLGPDALARYPKLATLVIRYIAEFAHIEGNLALVLSHCLRSDIKTGTAMYQALVGSDAKRAALEAAAKVSLSAEDFQLFLAVTKVIAPARSRRNDFAHKVWGYTEEIPDALMLLHPNLIINHSVGWRQYVEDNKTPIAVEQGVVRHVISVPPESQMDYSQIQVFKEKDLERDVKIAEKAADLVMRLYELTRFRGGDAAARAALSAEPQIAAILQKPTPSPPPESPSQ